MRRVFLFGFCALSLASCAPLQATAQDRFVGFGFRRETRPAPVEYDEDPPCSRWRAPVRSYRPTFADLREREELEFRFRRQDLYEAPPPRRTYRPRYAEDCDDSREFGSRRWLLHQGPSGRLRLYRLAADD